MLKRKIIVMWMIVSLIAGCGLSSERYVSAAKQAPFDKAEINQRKEIRADLAKGDYVEGEVIVTLAVPNDRDVSLIKKGKDTLDTDLTVKESFELGEAEALGQTTAQRRFLNDKSLYVAEVSSDQDSTEEMIMELSRRAYVVSVEPNHKHRLVDEKIKTRSNKKRAAENEDEEDNKEDNNKDEGELDITRNMRDFQWYLEGGRSASEGIHRKAVDQSEIKEEPVVAIIDTGIDFSHKDLKDRMWVNTSDQLEGTYGYDCVNEEGDPIDPDGHGTHCAGIIGAAGDESGILGVSDKVKMMALNIFDEESEADDMDILEAFEYVYRAQLQGVNIVAVNCSWGGGTTGQAQKILIEKIGKLGAVFVFAAGNDGENWDESTELGTPYDIDSEYTIIVGSSDTSDAKSFFSDYGKTKVDFFAPGSQMLSTVSYTNFYPFLLSDEKREESCLFFSSGEEGDLTLADFSGVKKVTHVADDVYGDAESGSYLLEYEKPKRFNRAVEIYIDVTKYDLSSAEVFYLCADLGYVEERGVLWESIWMEISPDQLKKINRKTYARIVQLEPREGESGVYLDNFAISRPDLSDEYMIKYEQFSGTSMAAPVVSGAMAVLAGLRVNDSVLERKEIIFQCLRMEDSLADQAIRGGILDMAKMSKVTPDLVPNPSVIEPEPPTPTAPTQSETPVYSPLDGGTPSDSDSSPAEVTTQKDTSKTEKILANKIRVKKKSVSVKPGKKLKLKAVVTPKNATVKTVKWYVKKKNKKYVKISKTGVVIPYKRGKGHKVRVYAMTTDGTRKKAYCTVKIIG